MALESSALDDHDDLENTENQLSNPEPISPPVRVVAQPGNGSVESGADAPAPLSAPKPVESGQSGHTSNNGDGPDGSPDAGDDYSSTLWNSGAQRAFSLARGNVEQRARATVAGVFDGENNFGIIGSAISAFKNAVGGGSAPADANAGSGDGTGDGGIAPPVILPAAHALPGARTTQSLTELAIGSAGGTLARLGLGESPGNGEGSLIPAAVPIEGAKVRSAGAGNGSGSGNGADASNGQSGSVEDPPANPVHANDGIGSLVMRVGLGVALPLAANGRVQAALTDFLHGPGSPAPTGSPPEGGDTAPQSPPAARRHPLNNSLEETNSPLADLQSGVENALAAPLRKNPVPSPQQGAFSILGLDFSLPTLNPTGAPAPAEPPRASNAHPPKQLGESGDVGNGSPITPETAQQMARAMAGVFSFQGQISNILELSTRNLHQNGSSSESGEEALKKLLAAGGRHAVDTASTTATGSDTSNNLIQTFTRFLTNPLASLTPGESPAPVKVHGTGSPVPSPAHPLGSGQEPDALNPFSVLPAIRRATDVHNTVVNSSGDGAAVLLGNQIITAGGRATELTAGEFLKRFLPAPEPSGDVGNVTLPAPVPSRFTPELQNFFRNLVVPTTEAEPAKEIRRVPSVTEDSGTPVEINRFQNALRNLLQLEADTTNLPRIDHPNKVVPADNSPLQTLLNQILPRTAERPPADLPESATLTSRVLTNMAALVTPPADRDPSGSPDVSGHAALPRLENIPTRLLDLIAPSSGAPRDNNPPPSPENGEQDESSLVRMLVAAMSASAMRSEALPGAIKLSSSLLARESVDPTALAGFGIKINEAGRLLLEPVKPGSEIGRVLSAGEISRLLQSIELAGRTGEIGKLSNGQITIGRFIGLTDAGKPGENVAIPGLDGRFTAGLDGRLAAGIDGRITRGVHNIGALEIQVDKSGRLIISDLTPIKGIGIVVASGIELGDKRQLGGKPDGRIPFSEVTGGVRGNNDAVSGITITIGKEFTGEKGIRGSGKKKDPDEEEDEAADSNSNGGLGFFGTNNSSTSQTDPQNQPGGGVDPQTQINISQIDPNSVLPGVTIVMGGPTDPANAPDPQPCHTPAQGPNNAQLDASVIAIDPPSAEVRLSWRDGDRFNPDSRAADRAVHAEDLGPIASAMPAAQLIQPIENQAPAPVVQPAENIDQQPIQWKQQADPYIAAPNLMDPFDMRLDLTERKVPDCRIDLKDEKEDELERMRCWKEREAKRVMDTLAADQATRKNQRLFVEEEVRTRYIVRPGDTLESIAQKFLHDGRLALLIFRINRAVIRVEYKDNKQIIHLKPNTVLQMPTRMEIEIFRATLGSKRLNNTKEALDVTTRINYTVRLGDNLRTVASRHPALKDATLWPLIAEINGLSTDANSEGSPSVRLQRGTTLRLPSTEEIAQFRLRQQAVVPDAV